MFLILFNGDVFKIEIKNFSKTKMILQTYWRFSNGQIDKSNIHLISILMEAF